MQFNCPSCGRPLAAPEGVFGQEGSCKYCGATVVSPHAEGASATLKSPGGSSFVPQPPPDAPGAGTPPPGASYSVPNPQYPPQGAYAPYSGKPQGSGIATASLVLGVLGLITCGLTGLAGLICGIIGLNQTGRGSGREGGRNIAIAGTVVSGAFMFLSIPILAAILFPVFAKARERAKETTCLNNVRQLGVAMQLYYQDYDGRLPPAASWNTLLIHHLPSSAQNSVFTCPSSTDGAVPYKMNRLASGISVYSLKSAANTVTIFDAAPGGSAFGGPREVEARHFVRAGGDTDTSSFSERQPAATYGFADGGVRLTMPSEVTAPNWIARTKSQ